MARAKRICNRVSCGKVADRAGMCTEHAAEYEAARGTRHERGYGQAHDAMRSALKRAFGASYRRGEAPRCWRCGERMHPWQALDADHSKIRASEGGQADCLTHAGCNRGKVVPLGHSAPRSAVDHEPGVVGRSADSGPLEGR